MSTRCKSFSFSPRSLFQSTYISHHVV